MPVSDLKRFGGGRAPGGLCGALYAACIIAPQRAEVLTNYFTQALGSAKCKDLRRANSEHCCECAVGTAADLLQDEMANRDLPSDHKG